jgi:uncharacterized protein YbjT (DUF2867 family)
MRVLVVGASGAIGTRLVPQLRQRAHEVIASSRSPGKAGRLRALGAEPIVLDVLDATAVRQAVAAVRPAGSGHLPDDCADRPEFHLADVEPREIPLGSPPVG